MSRYNSQRAVSPLSYQEVVQYTENLVPANMASKLRTQDGGGEIFKCSIWCLLPAADQDRRGQAERRAQQREQVGGISRLICFIARMHHEETHFEKTVKMGPAFI
jgi:hypothetical protein